MCTYMREMAIMLIIMLGTQSPSSTNINDDMTISTIMRASINPNFRTFYHSIYL